MKKNTERLSVRLPKETKQKLQFQTKVLNITASELLRELIDSLDLAGTLPTHEAKVSFYTCFNIFQNILTGHPELPDELRNDILKELAYYVGY